MAILTTAYDSFGHAYLQKLCKQYGIDRVVSQPDFASNGGYIITAYKGDKQTTSRIAQLHKDFKFGDLIKDMAQRLQEQT